MIYGIVPRMAVDVEMAERLRFARKEAGYESAAEAADAMDIPVPTYQAHENGSRGFRIKSATRYANFFQINAVWLTENKGLMKGKSNTGILDGLPPEAVREALDFIAYLRTKHGV